MEKPCREPSLNELLEDNAMRLLMASDKVEEKGLRALLDVIVAARTPAPPRCCA